MQEISLDWRVLCLPAAGSSRRRPLGYAARLARFQIRSDMVLRGLRTLGAVALASATSSLLFRLRFALCWCPVSLYLRGLQQPEDELVSRRSTFPLWTLKWVGRLFRRSRSRLPPESLGEHPDNCLCASAAYSNSLPLSIDQSI